MISTAIKRAFDKAQQRNWKELYLAIDIHDTMIKANYDKDNIPTDFFTNVLRILKYIQLRGDIVLIIYSCSHDSELVKYKELFDSKGIFFKYYNENPEVTTKPHGLGNYDKKMYFDILFEDKAGFDPTKDWLLAYNTLKQIPILK